MNVKLVSKLLFSVCLFYACATQKGSTGNGIVKGTTGMYEGNCMPSPGVPPCEPSPVSTVVYITRPSEHFLVELLEDSVVSDDQGSFEVGLPPGRYSLFLRDGDEIVCDGMECETDCFCTPFEVRKGTTTVVNANLDHASW